MVKCADCWFHRPLIKEAVELALKGKDNITLRAYKEGKEYCKLHIGEIHGAFVDANKERECESFSLIDPYFKRKSGVD